VRIHVDTDIAGDPDDVAALGYLLARPDVEITGVTTVDDPGGIRAGYAVEVLRMAGRSGIPVAAGAEVSSATGRPSGEAPPSDRRYWPAPVQPRPGPLEAAVDLLAGSVAAGAVVLGIGPATTLASAERSRPGLLAGAHVVLMGGFVAPPTAGLPQWTAADDWNVVCDVPAATEVRRAAGRLTVVPLATTAQAHLRGRDLPRLRAIGPVGELMSRQAESYRDDEDKAGLAATHDGLPDDLANFHHDPLAAAVAAGWDGVTVERRQLRTDPDDPWGRLEDVTSGGREVDLVTGVDGPALGEHWLATVEALRSR
jgi:inosine-uridine nucleoside N-ribohydrolase